MAQHFNELTVYEKMDLLIDVSNGIRADIEKRLIDNPADVVEKQENAWLYSIISNLPHHLIIDQLKERLSMFDRDTKYKEQ
jgi:hypothetical protein